MPFKEEKVNYILKHQLKFPPDLQINPEKNDIWSASNLFVGLKAIENEKK